MHIGSGTLSVEDVLIKDGGEHFGDSGLIRVSGNWNNLGDFDSGEGTVEFYDGNATSQIEGSNNFFNLRLISEGHKTVIFPVVSSTTVTGSLSAVGNNVLASSAAGQIVEIPVGSLGPLGDVRYRDLIISASIGPAMQPVPVFAFWQILLLVVVLLGYALRGAAYLLDKRSH